MSNVESAAAAGDSYNLRHVLLADGTGAVVGAALGSPFPPAVYIGHPGWKAAGGRISYSLASGVVIFLLCAFGLFPLLASLLPIPAIVPVLLFIGLVIGSQAFVAVPKAHYAAVVLAAIPSLAAWALGHGPRRAAGRGHERARRSASTRWPTAACSTAGWPTLGAGSVLVGMVLGTIAVFVIDRRFVHAAAACAVGGGADAGRADPRRGGPRLLEPEDRARLRPGRGRLPRLRARCASRRASPTCSTRSTSRSPPSATRRASSARRSGWLSRPETLKGSDPSSGVRPHWFGG